MSALQAGLLGIVQGITEFLPVSSSGHLVLLRTLMGVGDVPKLFDIILHGATLTVVVWFFRGRIGSLLSSLGRFLLLRSRPEDRSNLRLILQLAAASVLTGVIGLAILRLDISESPRFVGAMMLLTALLLISTARAKRTNKSGSFHWGQILIMGAAQGVGVLPGVSRSGITVSTGLHSGLERKASGEISFLLSIPAIVGAFLLTLKDAPELASSVPPLSLAAGFAASLLAGFFSLNLLLRLLAGNRLWIFSLYLIPVGAAFLIGLGR